MTSVAIIYGTVFDWDENGTLSCEVQDRKNINVTRNEIGFPSLDDALEKQMQVVKKEGGQAPENINEYKQKFNEWAKRVGWR